MKVWHIIGLVICSLFYSNTAAYAETITLSPVAGSRNQVQINEALKKGGVVHLNAGTYTIDNNIEMVSGATLEGDRGAKIFVADNVRWEKYRPVIRMLHLKNARVTGFEIDANRDNNMHPYITKEGAPGHQFYRIFYLYKADNVEIDHMYLHDTWDDVVFAEKAWNLNFHDNIVRRPGHDVVSIYHSGPAYVTNNCMRVYKFSGARTWGNSGPLYVVSNDIGKEPDITSWAGIYSRGIRSVAYDCNNNIHDVAKRHGLLDGGKIFTDNCPISVNMSIATQSCDPANLAAGGGTSTSSSSSSSSSGSTSNCPGSSSSGTSSGGGTSSGVVDYDTSSSTSDIPANLHIIGGFSARTDAEMAAVKATGGNAVMPYNTLGSLDNMQKRLVTLANRAASHGVMIIDDVPHQLLSRYKQNWDMDDLVSDMTAHLQYIAGNSSLKSKIIGYYMIGDWHEDLGKAKTALQNMSAIIHKYTPGKYSICGVSGNTGYGGSVSGYIPFASNYTEAGCDILGVYLYPYGSNKVPMTNLANILEAFKKVGWTPAKSPLMGMPQSYGGQWGYYVPTAAQVRTQTKYFCQMGAKHMLFYDYSTGTGNGTTSPAVQAGIKAGLSDCRAIWGD